jgi:hypothetical protein
MHAVFRPENKQGQDQERQVKANLDSKQTPDVNGPASHGSMTAVRLYGFGCYSYFTWSDILAPALEGTERCA